MPMRKNNTNNGNSPNRRGHINKDYYLAVAGSLCKSLTGMKRRNVCYNAQYFTLLLRKVPSSTVGSMIPYYVPELGVTVKEDVYVLGVEENGRADHHPWDLPVTVPSPCLHAGFPVRSAQSTSWGCSSLLIFSLVQGNLEGLSTNSSKV